MPTYEYVCKECGHHFETVQNISADPLKTCPRCGGLIERKIFGGVGLIFKGSGFYETDYKKASSKPTASKKKTVKKSTKKAS